MYRKLSRDEVLAIANELRADKVGLAQYVKGIAPEAKRILVTTESEYNDEYYDMDVIVRVYDAYGRRVNKFFDSGHVAKLLNIDIDDESRDEPPDFDLMFDLDAATIIPDLYVKEGE